MRLRKGGVSPERGALYFRSRRKTKPAQLAAEPEVPREIIADLLTSFLFGALGLELIENIDRLQRLPVEHRKRLREIQAEDLTWVAWRTDRGVVAATGRYYRDQSRRSNAHIMFIEWWIPPDTHHAGWWRADPERPSEWTAGRGRRLGALATVPTHSIYKE